MRFRINEGLMIPPTEKQLELIEYMEDFVNERFTGDTIDEASDYIDRNIDRFNLEIMDEWQLKYM